MPKEKKRSKNNFRINLELHVIGTAAALGIGAGLSLLGGLFADDTTEAPTQADIRKAAERVAGQIQGISDAERQQLITQIIDQQEKVSSQVTQLRTDQKGFYNEALGEVNNQFQSVLTNFNQNLAGYTQQLEQQFPQRKNEIQAIFSEQNPQIKEYVDNLKKDYENTKDRVYDQVKKANTEEIRRWQATGISGGTIARQIAGQQMERTRQSEQILTTKFNQVLQPQAQLAQQSIGAQLGAEQQQAQALQAAGQLGVTGAAGIQGQQAGAVTGLAGQNVAQQGQIGLGGLQAQTGIAQTGLSGLAGIGAANIRGQSGALTQGIPGQVIPSGQPGGAGGLFQGAGQQFIGAGVERLLGSRKKNT